MSRCGAGAAGASITVMVAYALAGGVQRGEFVNGLCGRIVGRVAPRLARRRLRSQKMQAWVSGG